MSQKLNLMTLAANAARAKQALARQTEKVQGLNKQLIERVGQQGLTIKTYVGQVVVTSRTFDRTTDKTMLVFNPDAFNVLDADTQNKLIKAGVVRQEVVRIQGQDPKVQYRLV